jgi:hypothetical protein
MEDIEDLFNEDKYEETKDDTLVVPEFGPCSADTEEDSTTTGH